MIGLDTQSSDALPRRRRRRIKFIVVAIVCVALIAAVRELRSPWIGFQLLRFRTTTSFVVVSYNDRKMAFSLDEKQTRDVLNVIENRTYGPLRRRSVIYSEKVYVFCKDNRSSCLRKIWVHLSPYTETESSDVIEELLRIAERGVPEDPDSLDGLCEDTHWIERVFD